jgi:hypothetical protein
MPQGTILMIIRKLTREEVAVEFRNPATANSVIEGSIRQHPRRPLRGSSVPLTREQVYWATGVKRVVGVDEAGSEAICGPLLAAAVELPRDLDASLLDEVRDCKLIASHNTRR